MLTMYRLYKKSWLIQLCVMLALFLTFLPLLYAFDVNGFEPTLQSASPLASVRVGWDWDNQMHVPWLSPEFLLAGFAAMALMVIAVPLIYFHFLHGKRGRDFYFAMPVTKGELFRANYVAGLVTLFVPAVIASLGFLLVHVSMSPATDPVGGIATNLFSALALLWVVYTLNVWACVQTRSTVEAFTLMGVVHVGFLVVGWLMIITLEQLLFGFSNLGGLDLYYSLRLLGFSSAGFTATTNLIWAREGVSPLPSLFWLVLGGIGLFHANHSIRKQQPEHIGKGNAAGISPWLIKTAAVLSAGLMVTAFTHDGVSGVGLLQLMLLFMLGSLIAFVLVQFVIVRRVDLSKSLVQYSLLAGLGIAYLAVLVTGAFGYSQRVPQASQVAQVRFDRSSSFPVTTNFQNWVRHIPWEEQYFDDPDIIQLFVNMHQAIVDTPGVLHPHNPNLYNNWGNWFSYTLHDGSTFERQFNWVPETIRSYQLELLAHPTFVQTFGTPFAFAFDDVFDLDIVTVGGSLFPPLTQGSRIMDLNRTQTYALLEAMQGDMLAQTPQQLLNPSHAGLFVIRGGLWEEFNVTVFPWWTQTLDTLTDFGHVVNPQVRADHAVITTRDQLNWINERELSNWSHDQLVYTIHSPAPHQILGYGEYQVVTDPDLIASLAFDTVTHAHELLVEDYQVVLFYHQGVLVDVRLNVR